MKDRPALEAFYHATNGPNWSTREHNWLTDEPLWRWSGVGTQLGRVVTLELDSGYFSLEGELPPELGQLSKLRVLVLNNFNLADKYLRNWGIFPNWRI